MHRHLSLAASAIVGCLATITHAQTGGNIYLNFGGGASGVGAIGTLDPMDVTIFPGFVAADTAAVKTKIVQYVQADYQPFSLSITDTDPGGTRTVVTIGNKVGDASQLFGAASIIDWRNKSLDDRVGVSLQAHYNYQLDAGGASNGKFQGTTNYTVDQLARALANTVTHEIGHTLGLVHSDPVSTYSETAGNAAAKQAAVQSGEFMTKAPGDTNFFGSALGFGTYSTIKLKAGAYPDGIKVQNENDETGISSGGPTEPVARAGDTGATVSTGDLLQPDEHGRVNVLGTLTTGGVGAGDYFKFDGGQGYQVRAEVMSQRLDRIADNISPVLQLLRYDPNTMNDVVVQSSIFPTDGNWDGFGAAGGDLEGEAIIYDFALPVTGLYAFRVYDSNTGAGAGGQYELFVQVPEPAGLALLGLLAATLRRRRARP